MERDFQLMQWLDAHDYAEAWIGEHHSGGYEIYGQPELFIATPAERTRQIRLGTGVISLPYHHPFMVADRIVQLDYQTRGRAMFGFGPGLLPSDAMMLGIDPETQRDRMADAIDIITRLLDGETITQQSEWYAMREARLHLRPNAGFGFAPVGVALQAHVFVFERAPGSFDKNIVHPAASPVHGDPDFGGAQRAVKAALVN